MTSDSDLRGARLAIANRAEIAIRIASTAERLGMVPVLLLAEPDLDGLAARRVGRVEPVGGAGSELDVELVVAAAVRAGADYLHPGYGFLSERAALAEACERAGIRFVGPTAATLRLCGDKLETRAAARRAGVPVLPASQPLGDDPAEWAAAGERVGYPLLVKPAGAGGGRGLRHVPNAAALADAVAASRREGEASGAGAVIYLERELVTPRHVEVQVASDGTNALALGDRDCSLQRRHQKVIEEAPAPNIDAPTRQRLHGHTRDLALEVGLRGIATCEFLLGADGTIAFLEINPRIQVEHPVTELVTGIDLVHWQLRIAAGGRLPLVTVPAPRGHAVEARVYAEDPVAGFRPSPGALGPVSWPAGPDVRVDAGYGPYDTVPHAYDAMLAKVIAHGEDRDQAVAGLRQALRDTVVAGVASNTGWLLDLLDTDDFNRGTATTQTAGATDPTRRDHRMAGYAALAHTFAATSGDATDPWAAVGPWRMHGGVSLAFHGGDWEVRYVVTRAGAGWIVDDGEQRLAVAWRRSPGGIWTICAGDEVTRLAVTPAGNGLEVTGQGGRWQVTPGPRPVAGAARADRPSDGQVRAPMPASVVSVHAVAGDQVTKGQTLVTLNAMKMEILCEAPYDGVVEMVACAPGELVSADQVLATLRASGLD